MKLKLDVKYDIEDIEKYVCIDAVLMSKESMKISFISLTSQRKVSNTALTKIYNFNAFR